MKRILGLGLASACTVAAQHEAPAPAPATPHGGHADKADGPAGFWWKGARATDATAIENSGIEATFQVVNSPPPIGCIDWWTSETVMDGFWGQVGAEACTFTGGTTSFRAFYQVWDPTGIELVDASTPVSEGLHTFSMFVSEGTIWAFSIDAHAFGSFDMGSAASDGVSAQTLCEQGDGVPAPYIGPEVYFPEVMSVLHQGTWMQPTGAVVKDTANIAGVVGANEDGALTANQMRIDGSTAFVAPDTPLWNSPPSNSYFPAVTTNDSVPFVLLDAPAAGSKESGSVAITARAAAAAGIQVVWFFVDGQSACTRTAAPFTCEWDTSQVPDGAHYVSVAVADGADHINWVKNTVTVDNAP
jgi:hypothetical protein